jgi:hypothetical protein
MKIATDWEEIPEQNPNHLTVGDLIELISELDHDMPVTFSLLINGDCHFVVFADVRKLNEQGEILKRDHEDDFPTAIPVFNLSALGSNSQ